MAMRHPKSIVLSGALGALFVMTVSLMFPVFQFTNIKCLRIHDFDTLIQLLSFYAELLIYLTLGFGFIGSSAYRSPPCCVLMTLSM